MPRPHTWAKQAHKPMRGPGWPGPCALLQGQSAQSPRPEQGDPEGHSAHRTKGNGAKGSSSSQQAQHPQYCPRPGFLLDEVHCSEPFMGSREDYKVTL